MKHDQLKQRRLKQRRLTIACCVVILASVAKPACAEELKLPISAPARSVAPAIPSQANASMQMTMPTDSELQMILPEGKLPQYQLQYRNRDFMSAQQRESGTLWFDLVSNDASSTDASAANATLTVQAIIRINGKPFTTARSTQIERLVSVAKEEAKGEEAKNEEAQNEKIKSESDTGSQYQPASTPEEMIRRYAAATGEEITSEDAEWLMTNWNQGPQFLLFNDPFQWNRSDQRPVFQILDQNRDGKIQADEIVSAANTLAKCDSNEDEIVDTNEIQQAVKMVAAQSKGFERRIQLHDLSGFDKPAIDTPTTDTPTTDTPAINADLIIEVDFYTESESPAQLAVTAIGDSIREKLTDLRANENGIEFRVDSRPYELSAVFDKTSEQISFGAVIEGYPLLPAADPNGDGRVTIRELRTFAERLKQADRNGDGELTSVETLPMTRLCIAQGPIVHRELDQLRATARMNLQKSGTTTTPAPQAPQWFTRMDRNQDQDLSRSEFPGTDEQFDSLDFDNDGLIASAEAVRFDKQSK